MPRGRWSRCPLAFMLCNLLAGPYRQARLVIYGSAPAETSRWSILLAPPLLPKNVGPVGKKLWPDLSTVPTSVNNDRPVTVS
eukprot:4724183-Pyramimonas_sp.AAC.1